MSDSESESDANYSSDGSEDFAPTSATKKKVVSKPLSDATNTPSKGSKKSNASDQYQKLSQLEHILKRPDTYIGSIEKTPTEIWCFNSVTETMEYKEVTIVPGLYKIFDEILVNAADNKIRDPSMKNIKIAIDEENNTISVMNDGRGIPIEIHDKEKIYIPELIFGNLLTSSNYDDDEKKVTGGRNGYGAKLCNIFSTEFHLETADLNTGFLYKQTWLDNMSKVSKPKITKLKTKKEYTKITFKPDLSKFSMESLDGDIISVLKRRVYDLCGSVKDCNIYLNDKKLAIKNFKNYIELYVKAIKEKSPDPEVNEVTSKPFIPLVHEKVNDRWEIGFAVSDGNFNQVSFVNSIATTSGGTHVKYVSDQIFKKLIEVLSKKEKKKLKVRAQDIRNHTFLFLNCLIENPAFTSQTKEQLTTRVSQFSSPGDKLISDSFIQKILSTSIVEKIRDINDANNDKELQKADGSRKLRVKNQVKLVDANFAGTKKGNECVLILTEGDSALSLAVSGLAVVGRDRYGCFPLRGKMLNVREASTDQISKNAEINALKQIIGLQHKKHYNQENIKSLRYGHIMIMTDQDQDGSHIKGLLINFLETSFPGLLEIPGFLLEFITPIVKVKALGQTTSFYSMPEFEQWRDTVGRTCRWSHKYYKGLGTSSPSEAREYFSALDKHMKQFHQLQSEDQQLIDLAFSKKKADERKDWLQSFQPGTHLDPTLNVIPISDFINKELILFSMADNVRSIPSVLDGFKPGQRKVLYACFKRKLVGEIKVAQLVGYVSEHTAYHHGEQSLFQTIIGLAQNFIGSNNINVLYPKGAFGSRDAGGKDAAAARYIFTKVTDLTRKIFNPLDNPLYTYVQDDEQTVEPEWYLPVIPMILVNGAEGIGTGWSTNIPCFNPEDLVSNIKRLMNGEELEELVPWYKGWEGTIEPNGDKYKVKGRIEQIDDNTLEITEIPVKTWTNNMKEFLLSGLGNDKVKQWIKDVEEQHGLNIKFVVKLTNEEMAKSLKIGLLERFKLTSSINLSNMVAFDSLGRIKKYENPNDMLREFYYVRLEYYQKRKDYMAEDLQFRLLKLNEQARFIKLIIDKQLSISNKKRAELVDSLIKHGFKGFSKEGKPVNDVVKEEDQIIGEEIAEEELGTEATHKPETVYSQYDYLLGMSLWSLTRERYEKLLSQVEEIQRELNELLKKSAKDLWNIDLDEFVEGWHKFLEEDFQERNSIIPNKSTSKKRRARKTDTKKSEPAAKKAKVKVEVAKPKAKAEAVKPKAKTEAAKPKAKKQSRLFADSDDDLPSFFSKESSEEAKPKAAAKNKPKVHSIFSDSDDDMILGDSSSRSIQIDLEEDEPVTKSKPVVLDDSEEEAVVKPKPKPSKKKSNIKDELDDLIETPPPTGGRSKRKISYKLKESLDDEEMSEAEEESDFEYSE